MFLKQSFNLLTIVWAGAFLAPPQLLASSCCTGSGGQSICVLPFEQHYQLGVTSSYRLIRGQFDPYGNYTQNAESSRQMTTTLGGAYRLGEDWQVGISIPLVTQQLASHSRSATAFGDPLVEARYTLWEDLVFLRFRPQLTFYGGLKIPLGNSISDSRDPSGTVSDGMTTFHAGWNTSKLYRPIKFTWDGIFFYPLGVAIPHSYQLRAGQRFQLMETVTYLFNQNWSGSLGMRQLWVTQSSVNGNTLDSSAQRLFSSLASLNYFPSSSWSLGISYETVFPFYQYLINQPNVHTVTLAASYGGL